MMMKWFNLLMLIGWTRAFAPAHISRVQSTLANPLSLPSSQLLSSSNENDWESADFTDPIPTDIETFLKTKFPQFFYLMKRNEEIMKLISSSYDGSSENQEKYENKGLTFFCPNAEAFNNLGAKRLAQLEDERNEETVEKIAAYHVVPLEAVDARRLTTEDWTRGRPKNGKPAFTVEGVNTMGGMVPVGRSAIDKGLFGTGWFAKKEGDQAVIGTSNAEIVRTYTSKNNNPKWIVHEVTALTSPELLWRYCDQLRIPGF